MALPSVLQRLASLATPGFSSGRTNTTSKEHIPFQIRDGWADPTTGVPEITFKSDNPRMFVHVPSKQKFDSRRSEKIDMENIYGTLRFPKGFHGFRECVGLGSCHMVLKRLSEKWLKMQRSLRTSIVSHPARKNNFLGSSVKRPTTAPHEYPNFTAFGITTSTTTMNRANISSNASADFAVVTTISVTGEVRIGTILLSKSSARVA